MPDAVHVTGWSASPPSVLGDLDWRRSQSTLGHVRSVRSTESVSRFRVPPQWGWLGLECWPRPVWLAEPAEAGTSTPETQNRNTARRNALESRPSISRAAP